MQLIEYKRMCNHPPSDNDHGVVALNESIIDIRDSIDELNENIKNDSEEIEKMRDNKIRMDESSTFSENNGEMSCSNDKNTARKRTRREGHSAEEATEMVQVAETSMEVEGSNVFVTQTFIDGLDDSSSDDESLLGTKN